jgi:Tol biopolymer transport system component/DNA-binding winged helix-turn-helix (wHTH) protein
MAYHAATDLQGGFSMASPHTQQGTIRFGQFELDPATRELRKSGGVVKLQRQQFAVLLLLVERAGQIVSREDIHQHIWGSDTFVDFERGINFAINQIRVALEDDADYPRFIETIPRRGYRFLCPIEVSQSAPVQPEASTATAPIGDAPFRASVASDITAASQAGAKTDKPPKGAGKWLLPGLGFAMLLILAGIFIARHNGLRPHWPWFAKAGTAAERAHTVTLTNVRGLVDSPVFSPDGKQIAFFWNGPDQNKLDVYVQMIGGEQPVRLTYSGARRICCLDWSSDGERISFVRCNHDAGAVYTVPALGGAELKLTDVTCREFYMGTPTWTLDGKSMLLVDHCVPDGPYGIVMFTLETGQKRCLTAPASNDAEDSGLHLSPDGRSVAFVQSPKMSDIGAIYVIPLEGGTPRQLTSGNPVTDMMWAADGKRIVFLSQQGYTPSDRLWQISLEGGRVEPETVYQHLGALSRDGQRLAYVVFGNGDPSISRADLSGPGGHVLGRKKILSSSLYDGQPQLSPDGTKIVFSSQRSGVGEIWRSEADGSNPIQLTSTGQEPGGTPRWSPDGNWITFDLRPGKHSQIYVMDTEGRNMRAMTEDDYGDYVPSSSRDGQSIYFGSMRSGSLQLWKQSVHGGGAVQITQHGGFTGFESYDGKTLYYSKFDSEGVWSIPVSGGAETLVTPALRAGYWGAWAVSETGIYLIDDEVLPRPTIEFYNFRTRRLTAVMQMENSPLDHDPSLDASRDGRIVLFAQHRPQSSIAMVENFQ